MTALPTTAFLRRHDVPPFRLHDLGPRPATPRPRLAAGWRLDEHGRLACLWTPHPASAPPAVQPATLASAAG